MEMEPNVLNQLLNVELALMMVRERNVLILQLLVSRAISIMVLELDAFQTQTNV